MSGFKSKNFNIPEGIEYYMAGEAKIFEKLKRNISSIYTKSKYSYVITPIFDNLDNLLSLKSTDLDNQTTFVLDKINRTEVGIRADNGKVVIRIDPKYFRPTEVDELMGDSFKAIEKLGWKPETNLEELIAEMIDNDLNEAKKEVFLKEKGFKINSFFE
mgnify:CR=1 FL=1